MVFSYSPDHDSCGNLHPADIQTSLTGSDLRGPVILFQSIGSTNRAALELADDQTPDGMVVAADSQREGEGRMGRKWFSVEGKSAVFSLVTRPGGSLEGYTLMCGLGVVKALDQVCEGLEIKWPNDIYSGGKKLGGILTESRRGMVVTGIGINVNEQREDFNREVAELATSIRIESGKKQDRVRIISVIINKLDSLYREWKEGGFSSFRDEVQSRMMNVGRGVTLRTAGENIEGRVMGITGRGYLEMEVGGKIKHFSTGDLSAREINQEK